MNRRQFIATLTGAAAAAALAPLAKLTPVEQAAWLSEELHVGDVITIEGVFATNPVTGKTIAGHLQEFIITATVSSDNSTDEVSIYPMLANGGSDKVDRKRILPCLKTSYTDKI